MPAQSPAQRFPSEEQESDRMRATSYARQLTNLWVKHLADEIRRAISNTMLEAHDSYPVGERAEYTQAQMREALLAVMKNRIADILEEDLPEMVRFAMEDARAEQTDLQPEMSTEHRPQ